MDKEAEAPGESKTHPDAQVQNQDLHVGALGLPKPCSRHSVALAREEMPGKDKKST